MEALSFVSDWVQKSIGSFTTNSFMDYYDCTANKVGMDAIPCCVHMTLTVAAARLADVVCCRLSCRRHPIHWLSYELEDALTK